MNAAATNLAILLWATSPERPDLAASPFVYAAVAAAMDCRVEVHFAGRSVHLLLPGVAASLKTLDGGDHSVYDFMRDAAAHGARFLGCSMAMAAYLAEQPERIPEYAGAAGAGAFVSRTLDPAWRTLVF